ncbi:UNVERIFIED_CONTAM: hypothetical protein K2H54_063535 [Gekko kuhli]
MKFSGDDTVHLSLPVEIGIEAVSKTGIFSSLAKVKIDIVAKLLWDASKDQIFIIEASKIIINDIQVKEKQRVTGPDKKHVRSMIWTILNDVATFLIPSPGDSPSAASFQMNPQPGTNFQLALSKDFISIGIAAMTGSSSASLTKGAGKPFLTTDLASVIPQISEHFSIPQPLVVKIKASKFPLVSMNSQGAVVKQSLFTDVCTPGQTVLHFQVNTIFKAMFSASNRKLFISLSQNSFDIVQASSSIGSSNAQKLHDWVNGIYMNSYLPAVNGWPSDFNVTNTANLEP